MEEFDVRPGESRLPKSAPLGAISVKLSGKDTQGAFAVFEIPTAPFSGPASPPSIEKEWFRGLRASTSLKRATGMTA